MKLLLFISLGLACLRAQAQGGLALVGGTAYSSPTAAPIQDAVLLVSGGTITALGTRATVSIPQGYQVIDCAGATLMAGFWNNHVHFTESIWQGLDTAWVPRLQAHLDKMLNRWGFTTVWDLSSDPFQTNKLRQAVQAGKLKGPAILTVGGGIFPENGLPVYLPKDLKVPMATSPAKGAGIAKFMLQHGADGIKVFAGSIQQDTVIPMDSSIIKAIAQVAHRAGKPVFSHPTNALGVDNSLAGGVDVLAHVPSFNSSFTGPELQRMLKQQVALIPTLMLFPDEAKKYGGDSARVLRRVEALLANYHQVGGTILFGTDVGYTRLYDPTTEYQAMQQAGLSWQEILASLTTTPATFFHRGTGQLAGGQPGDVVVLLADPAVDVRNLAKVKLTLRAGQLLYRAP